MVTNKRNSGLALDSLTDELVNNTYLLFSNTAKASTSGEVENTLDAVRDSIFARNITQKDLRKVIQVPKGTRAIWKSDSRTGTTPGMYQFDGAIAKYNISPSNWYTYVNHEGYIFAILLNVVDGNTSNDPIRAINALSDTSGIIRQLPEGIRYCCIGKTDDLDVWNAYSKHITIQPVSDAFKSLNDYTSSETRATSICGAGNERRYGTCCLYYSTSHHDRIRGVTYAAGDFYRCTCTECYRCSEMAEALGMQYRFNKWASDTAGVTGGTGENCLHCDSEDFPSNCGPCSCTIPWNEKTYYYDTILDPSNTDFPKSSSIYENARIAKQNELQGGGIASVVMPFRKFTTEELKIPSTYRNEDILLPLLTDIETENIPKVRLKYEADGVNPDWIVLTGFDIEEVGSGATTIKIDYDTLISTYLPNVTRTKLEQYMKVNVLPTTGLHKAMNWLFDVRLLLDVQVPKSDISAVTGAVDVNSFSIVSGGGKDGSNPFAGVERNEPKYFRATTKLEVERSGATTSPTMGTGSKGSGSSSKSSITLSASTAALVSNSTIVVGDVVFSQSQADPTKADIELTGKQKLYKVGDTLNFDGDDWNTNTVENPIAPVSGDELDLSTIETLSNHTMSATKNIVDGTELHIQIYL